MSTLLWMAVAAAAVLWPGRLAGPLDGAPLDHTGEALLIGVALAWLLLSQAWVLRRPAARFLIVILLLWKAVVAASVSQDGWCLRFTTPAPIYLGGLVVPHTWDVRADWRTTVPACSAVMTTGYPVIERFPVWFYNLPPASELEPARPSDRPPHVMLALSLEGYLQNDQPGTLRIVTGDDVAARVDVDDRELTSDEVSDGVRLAAGPHHVSIQGNLSGSRWTLMPLWNGENLWDATVATLTPATGLDRWVRPWGRLVAPALIVALLAAAAFTLWRRAQSATALSYVAGMSALVALLGWSDHEITERGFSVLLIGAALLTLPRRLQNLFGASLLVGVPFLAMYAVIGARHVGVVTWYSSGDDWWMFQRFAYRIFMQGYWLEGGQATFWFQPLYRWIAGSLHMIFGDSSVGEFFWDAGCMLTGAAFAFHVTKVFAGARWGFVAATVTLATFTMGPAWYLFGRGLSEMSSAGFLYGGALLALRGRHGNRLAIAGAGLLATLAFYARLNNLPMALAVAVFAFPVRQAAEGLFDPGVWSTRAARGVMVGIVGAVLVGLCLFAFRTWYYTGVLSVFFGTQAGHTSIWRSDDGVLGLLARLASSLMMLLTMNDPPRFDVRALPILAGMLAAVAAVARLRGFRRLPLNAAVFALVGVAGAFVARGSAYPGRFSVHLIPVSATLATCALAHALTHRPGRQPVT